MREEAYAVAGGAEQRALVGKTEHDQADGVDTWFYNPEGGDFVVDEDALWACTNCGACVQQCPVDIEHVDHFVDMRRYQVLVESSFPSGSQRPLQGPGEQGQPVEHVGHGAPGLGQGPALRGQGRRRPDRGPGVRRLAVLGRLRRCLRGPRQEDDPRRRGACWTWRASRSASWATVRPAPVTLPAAPATSSCSRAWPSRTSRR
ncbi:(Fe-S)-binding protein [Nocardioides convexus]|uniref:4Fe-4S dicluster domain-containing protein n=1 Tax=Nocardioides convexus TaxID=2712224 RepID=UPI00241897D9|nr:(Fe-S)-binding protein [Nocardioides convexus]